MFTQIGHLNTFSLHNKLRMADGNTCPPPFESCGVNARLVWWTRAFHTEPHNHVIARETGATKTPVFNFQRRRSSCGFTNSNDDTICSLEKPGYTEYQGYCIPAIWNRQPRTRFQHDQQMLPEEVEYRTQLPRCSPHCAQSCTDMCNLHKVSQTPWLWYFISGSPRLALTAYETGLPVLCPVDVRYGWDLDNMDHPEVVQHLYRYFQPQVTGARCFVNV